MDGWKKDHVELICNVAELNGLFEKAASLDDFLATTVSVVAYHMRAAVCSIYLYEEGAQELVLAANQGLNKDFIGKLRLKLGEGITGLALKELKPICEGHGSRHPNFKNIPGINEERFEAFLAVPILRGMIRVGVIVVQDPQPDYFDNNDIRALRAIAAQLATTIENAKMLLQLHGVRYKEGEAPRLPDQGMVFLKGTPLSDGIGVGRTLVLDRMSEDVFRRYAHDTRKKSLNDFSRALRETQRQLEELQGRLEEQLEDVGSLIFSAHLLILKDDAFSGEMIRMIQAGSQPQTAVTEIVERYASLFAGSANPRLREKVQDIHDLAHRMLSNLMEDGTERKADYKARIVITRNLPPSSMLKLATQSPAGIVMMEGGVTSHVSILARSLRVPVVLVSHPRLAELPDGTEILIDACHGNVFVRPEKAIVAEYQTLGAQIEKTMHQQPAIEETFAANGESFQIMANMNLLSDMRVIKAAKAQGIGLYRTEFPFIIRNDFPSEEEQFRIYRRVLDEMAGKEVVFRTLDIGGDKMLPYFPMPNEPNPFMGLRAIRFSMRNRPVFSQQIRAFLRAGHERELNIMFPLVTSVDDFIMVKRFVGECADELIRESVPCNSAPRLGIMVEVPAAVELIDELAAVSDFLSIGTNDLTQYMLAVDRGNKSVADLYQSHHPAVLRALHRIVKAAHANGKKVSVCGDMASDPRLLSFLAGIGIRKFSINSVRRPELQKLIRELDIGKAEELAAQLLRMGTLREVSAFLGMA